ncbi:MAG TPA: TetR/AcrR family transcriptional regulator [Streptosporangiaceae bacterium]|jgi:AcrR family transcriptional regulator
MNKKVERGRATRDRLVEIATGMFAEHGYEGTSIEAVLRTAEVSRGALYHHFDGKDGLFEAVFEAVELDANRRLLAAVVDVEDPVEALRAGCLTWIELAGDDPVVQQVVLIDAPSVLGWQRWREVEERYGLGGTKLMLRRIAAAGRLSERYADPFAHMLLAALNETAILIARSDDAAKALRDGRAAVKELLDRLLPE